MEIKEISKFFGIGCNEVKSLIVENGWRIDEKGSYFKTIEVNKGNGKTKKIKAIVNPAAPGYFEVYIDKKGNVYYQDYISKGYYHMNEIQIQIVKDDNGVEAYHPVAIQNLNTKVQTEELLVQLENEVESHGVKILDPLTEKCLRIADNYPDLLMDLEECRVILTRDGKCYSNIVKYNGEEMLLSELLELVQTQSKHIKINPKFSLRAVGWKKD